jgi:hypothetical protein
VRFLGLGINTVIRLPLRLRGFACPQLQGATPQDGRYIQADPIGLGGGANKFGYANANPLRYVDPDGRFFFVPLLGPSVAAIVGDLGVAAAAWWALQPKKPEPTLLDPGYKPGSWPPPPPVPPLDKPEAWPGGDDWRGQCIRLYTQCQNQSWMGSCGACLNKCTAQQEWPFEGPGSCRPRRKGNSCDAF